MKNAWLLVLLAVTVLAPAADAARTRLRSGTARLSVVSDKGDTVVIQRPVKGVTISGEGIRIQGGEVVTGSGVVVKVPPIPDVPNPDVDVHIDFDDSSLKAMGYGHHGSGDIVQMFQDVHVPRQMVVNGDVVSIFGDVDVEGMVEGQVVSVLGGVELADSARVGGDVVSVGGHVRAAPTANIQGQTVSMPVFGPPRMAHWLPGVAMIASVLFFAILGIFVALLFPERLVRVAGTVSRRTFLSFLLGLLAFPMLPVVIVILCITVIGIPVAVLLLFLFPVAAFVGYVASCALMGARLTRQELGSGPVWRSVVVGLVIVGAFFVLGGMLTNLPSAGGLRVLGYAFFGLGLLIGSVNAVLGLGALMLSRLGEPERAAKTVAPPAPAGAAAFYAPPPSSG
jgi:hypothetical protein